MAWTLETVADLLVPGLNHQTFEAGVDGILVVRHELRRIDVHLYDPASRGILMKPLLTGQEVDDGTYKTVFVARVADAIKCLLQPKN